MIIKTFLRKYVEIALIINDFQTSDQHKTTDFIFYTQKDHLPVMLPLQNELDEDLITEIAHQAKIPKEKFMATIALIEKVETRQKI